MSAEQYDCPLRFLVPSRSHPEEKQMVELDAYNGNGACSCQWFVGKLGPLLKAGMRPEEAVAMKKVRRPDGVLMTDALRCFHIRTARNTYCDSRVQEQHDHEQAVMAKQF